jgi:hypothetical protein
MIQVHLSFPPVLQYWPGEMTTRRAGGLFQMPRVELETVPGPGF